MVDKLAVLRVQMRDELVQIVDLNHSHLKALVNPLMLNKVGDYSNEFDRYASDLFERPIRASWRTFRHIARIGVPHGSDGWGTVGVGNPWYWNPLSEKPYYPADEVLTFELFASIYLHEVAHGWYYLLLDEELLEKLSLSGEWESQPKTNWRRDEEEICWEISRFVCNLLEIPFDEEAIPDECPQYKSPAT